MDEFEELMRVGLKHLVGLYVETDAPGKGSAGRDSLRRLVLSGSVFSMGDSWVVCTAGHVVHELNELAQASARYQLRVWIVDRWASEGSFQNNVPLGYDPSRTFHFDNGEVDFGFIELTNNTRQLLEKNGVSPIDERHWSTAPDDAAFDTCGVLGVPANSVIVKHDGASDRIHVAPTLLQLEHLFDVPEHVMKKGAPLWYGRVPIDAYRRLDFKINGMSGGPVFGWRHKSPTETWYQIIGLQNAVTEDDDFCYFRVTPFYVIGRFLAEMCHHVASHERAVATEQRLGNG